LTKDRIIFGTKEITIAQLNEFQLKNTASTNKAGFPLLQDLETVSIIDILQLDREGADEVEEMSLLTDGKIVFFGDYQSCVRDIQDT
jgi:hypothetical protein